MEKIIEFYIKEEAKKHINRYHLYHNVLELEYNRNKKRIIDAPPKEIKIPEHWNNNSKFNPFYVYSKRKSIAHSIVKKLKNGTYEPFPPFKSSIEKKDGGTREISIYQIPDAAVSNYFYKRLLNKNKHRFSSFSYAYRDDRNVHFAIQDISLEIKKSSRLFIAEFDFSKFFNSIDHQFLLNQLDENGFLVTKEEKIIIESFIKQDSSERGIPQGTSLSLFLANVACWNLDRNLEDQGLKFARYADDTIIWSKDYYSISKAFEIINNFSKKSSVALNFKKSEGISLLSKKDLPSEISKTKSFFEFLGYKISTENVGIRESSILNIKKQISYLLYRNLIQPLKGTQLKALTVPNAQVLDPAFITAIMQIRRYLYGNLTDDRIIKYLNGIYKRIIFKGVMSFYPLIDDEKQLIYMDKWLCKTIYNSLVLRKKLFKKHGLTIGNHFFPYNFTRESMVKECKTIQINNKKALVAIPSFLRIYKALKKGVHTDGIVTTMNPNSNIYNYNE